MEGGGGRRGDEEAGERGPKRGRREDRNERTEAEIQSGMTSESLKEWR